jgi:site-specific DNA recombinase
MEIRDEGISGGKNKTRTGFMRLLDAIEAHEVNVIVLYSLERLSRDMLTLLALERLLDEYDCELHTVEGTVNTATPDAWLSFAMKALLGEHERRQIKHRTKRALQHKKSNGQVVGSIPYGFTRNQDSLVPIEEEQAVISKVNELYHKGMNLAEIQRYLRKNGIKTRNSKDWDASQVRRLIEGYTMRFKHSKSQIGESIREFITAIA